MFLERWLTIARMRVRSLFAASRLDHDVDDELRDHVERQMAAGVETGLSPQAARTAAFRSLGGLEQRKEEMRDTRGVMLVRSLMQDLGFALRMFRRRPAFSFVAAATLALGIGANTAIFAVVNGVLLQPLPFPAPDRLMLISSAPVDRLFGRALGLSEGQFLDFSRSTTLFEHVATFSSRPAVLTDAGEPVRLPVAAVSTDFFAVLQVEPSIGRTIFRGDDDALHNRVAVISDGLWRSNFGASRDAIGRVVKIDGVSHDIVGVMPAGFSFPDNPQVWTPLAIAVSGNSLRRTTVGRLRAGISSEQARSELASIVPGPPNNPNWQTVVLPLKERAIGGFRQPLAVLIAAVAFVLVIGCANVANLFLVRMAERDRELAVRVALGARRSRLLQQLLVESGVIALAGAAAGVLLTMIALPALVALAPRGTIPRVDLIRVDGLVLAFAVGLAALTAVAFGLLPAFRATRDNASRQGTHTRRHERLHATLVVAEVALSVVLLAGAGLLIKSFLRLRGVDTGFTVENVVAATVDLPAATFKTADAAKAFHAQALERVRALPGVAAAGAINWLPFGMMSMAGDLALDGGRPLPGNDYRVNKPAVSAGYFDAMSIKQLAGRAFTDQDDARALPVAVVSKTAAAELWPGEDPLGQRLSLETPPKQPRDWMTVVGVVDDVRQQGLTGDREPAIYQPYLQVQRPFFLAHVTFVARSTSEPAALVPLLRNAVRSVDSTVPPSSVQTMATLVSQWTASPAFQARLLAIFAAVALVLTMVGIYGVLSYSVSQRTREFGIRMALGAETSSVLRLVLGRTATFAGVGMLVGAAAAVGLTRLLTQVLFEVTPTDPSTFGLVAALLAGAALLAAAIPAWRASRVDPTIALRAE